MPNKTRIEQIFDDIRNKVAKNANFSYDLKKTFDIDISSTPGTLVLTKKTKK